MHYILQYKEVTMTDFLFLSLPNDLAYDDFKKQMQFGIHLQPFSFWAFKWPLTIYSHDQKYKHTFQNGQALVERVQQPVLEEKWKYFVITRADGTRLYCTSYVFYEKKSIKEQRSLFFSQSPTYAEFYVPKCLIFKSDKPYFKLQTNLVKIHRQLRRENSWVFQKITRQGLAALESELRSENQNHSQNMRKKLRTSLISMQKCRQSDHLPQPSVQSSLNYYISAANQQVQRQKIYVCPHNRFEVLHVYNIRESLFRANYFFHLPISMDNVLLILAAILQERQIIFTSSNQNSNLMLMETLLEMLAPLKWEYMYVPNLPEPMLDAAQYSFMPYMVGIHRKYLDRITTGGRVIVHVDADRVQADEPILELPATLANAFNAAFCWSDRDTSYLQWQKEIRARCILMMSSLLAQFPVVEQKNIQNSGYAFYWFFFQKSAMYQTFKQEIHRQQNVQISELFWLPHEVKLQVIEAKFKPIIDGAAYPTICENDKEWVKYYYQAEKGRRSLKNGRRSFNYNNSSNLQSQGLLKSMSITASTVSIEGSWENRSNNGNRVHALAKKGIGFAHRL